MNTWFTMSIRQLTGFIIPVVIAICFLASCACRTPEDKKQSKSTNDQREDLIRHQQDIVKDESEDIENYIKRRNYSMTATQTGLRYSIYHKGSGTTPVRDDTVVEIKYNVTLLDGAKVYSSESRKKVKVGKTEVASGLHEGLKLMHEGDKAIFILPSHLAYGLTGDGDKIKSYQVLVINVELLSIINNQ